MRKRLHLVLMASPVIATFLSLMPLPAQAADDSASTPALTAVTDDSGRRVWVNDSTPSARMSPQTRANGSEQRRLVYWSTKEHRYKPVPHAVMQAARSAAAEVNDMLASSGFNLSRSSFSPEQVDSAIDAAAYRHNLDPNLVRAVIKVESNFNPNAISRKGAMGLMQLMPSTARQLKVTNPFDPEQNVDAGVRHLKSLLQEYRGNVPLTLAAYNAGEGAVARSAGIPRIAETRDYVRRITALYNGGTASDAHFGPHAAVKVQRDERGVLYISNTD